MLIFCAQVHANNYRTVIFLFLVKEQHDIENQTNPGTTALNDLSNQPKEISNTLPDAVMSFHLDICFQCIAILFRVHDIATIWC